MAEHKERYWLFPGFDQYVHIYLPFIQWRARHAQREARRASACYNIPNPTHMREASMRLLAVIAMASLAVTACKTSSPAATVAADDSPGVRPLPTGVALMSPATANNPVRPVINQLPLSGFDYNADTLDCAPGGSEGYTCRPKVAPLAGYCFQGDMMKACALMAALSDRSVQAYSAGNHDRTVMTGCRLTSGQKSARVDFKMSTDYPEVGNEEAVIFAEAVISPCGQPADDTGSARLYRKTDGVEITRFPASGFSHNESDLNCNGIACTLKVPGMGNVCYRGTPAETCETFKRLSDKADQAYADGDHDSVGMDQCTPTASDVKVAYTMRTDYTDYVIKDVATIKPCP